MKTKEFVKKYNLSETDKIDQEAFINDLLHELVGLLEYNKAFDNLKGFKNSVNALKMKYDAINNKTKGDLNIWNYFYATKVVPLRNTYCKREVDIENRRREERDRRNKERQAYWDQQEREWEEMRRKRFGNAFEFFLLGMFLKTNVKPIAEIEFLGLNKDDELTENIVKKAYRKLSMVHHPDQGGKKEDFIKLEKAKNTVLCYLK